MKLLRFLTISVTALLIAGAQVAQALSFDNDVPKDIQSQVVADLGFMAQIQGSNQTKLKIGCEFTLSRFAVPLLPKPRVGLD